MTADGDRRTMSYSAGDYETLLKMVQQQFPDFTMEQLKQQATIQTIENPEMHFKVQFHCDVIRSMVKSACALAFDCGVSTVECELALPILLSDCSDSCTCNLIGLIGRGRDLFPNALTTDSHLVYVASDAQIGLVVAYVSVFGMEITIPLTLKHEGNEFRKSYCINATTGKEVKVDHAPDALAVGCEFLGIPKPEFLWPDRSA